MKITVDKISKSYTQGGEKISALKDVSLHIPSGSTLSIVGHSGSGKTTLLSILAGLERPDSGSVSLDNSVITQMNEKDLTVFRAKQMGIVFQQYHLMPHLSALENVLLPLEINHISNAKERAQEVLAKVGLEKRMTHLPSQLSGGENQRVAIARAMVHAPAVVFADEPSGSLDLKNGQWIMQLLLDLTTFSKTTLVLVTHDNQLAKLCQHSIHLRDGLVQNEILRDGIEPL